MSKLIINYNGKVIIHSLYSMFYKFANVRTYCKDLAMQFLNKFWIVAFAFYNGLARAEFQSLNEDGKIFDFIIVGGGTAGCVVARRLAETGRHTVLLIEEGGIPNSNLDIPGIQVFTEMYKFPNDVKFYASVPQKNVELANNGIIQYPIGKVLGGGSSVNAMIWNRGHPQDYDNWARLTKDPSWSYENMLKYFKRSESYSRLNPTNQRGLSGPISVINPIYTFAADKLLEAGQEIGYPIGDPNGPQTPSVAKLDFSHKRGRRASAFSEYIKPVLKKLNNLQIILNTEAKRILFEGKRTVGVTFKNNSYAMARKEIILTAGTLDSALILQRSGVGPKEVLQKSGIPIVTELPVGENLHTHPAIQFPIIYGNRSALFIQSRDLTPEAWRLYQEIGTGPYSYYIGASAQGFFLSRKAQSNWPDIQIIPFGMETGSLQDVPDLQVWEASSQWRIEGLRPKSYGVIKLNPKDSNEAPFLDFRLLTHPDDVQLIVEGIKLVQSLCEGTNAFQIVGCRLSKVPYSVCRHFSFQSDAYWACFAKQFGVASSHAVGTCRMGSPEDPEAVVDSQLNVLGIKGLRIADASVMPQVTNANTQAAVYGIAEKAADLILSKWEPQHH